MTNKMIRNKPALFSDKWHASVLKAGKSAWLCQDSFETLLQQLSAAGLLTCPTNDDKIISALKSAWREMSTVSYVNLANLGGVE